jgi:NADH-quinone oxidoreductase subunit M
MIAVSVGFGLFPMHLYDVVRSGVDPLVARITQVVPVAQTGRGSGVAGETTTPGKPSSVPMAAADRMSQALYPSRGRE